MNPIPDIVDIPITTRIFGIVLIFVLLGISLVMIILELKAKDEEAKKIDALIEGTDGIYRRDSDGSFWRGLIGLTFFGATAFIWARSFVLYGTYRQNFEGIPDRKERKKRKS